MPSLPLCTTGKVMAHKHEKENHSRELLPSHLSWFHSRENRICFHYKMELKTGLTVRDSVPLSTYWELVGSNLYRIWPGCHSWLPGDFFPNIPMSSRMEYGVMMKIEKSDCILWAISRINTVNYFHRHKTLWISSKQIHIWMIFC